jgi:hypothetical protein
MRFHTCSQLADRHGLQVFQAQGRGAGRARLAAIARLGKLAGAHGTARAPVRGAALPSRVCSVAPRSDIRHFCLKFAAHRPAVS